MRRTDLGRLRLNCPGCGTRVDDGVSICPRCDYIIDTSFLELEPPERDDEPSSEEEVITSPRQLPEDDGATRIRRIDELQATARPRRQARRAPPPREQPAPPPRRRAHRVDEGLDEVIAEPESGLAAPEQVLGEARAFVGQLGTADKLAVAGFGLAGLFCLFPWKETAAEGESIGLLDLGFGVFALSLLGIGAVVFRVRQLWAAQGPLLPWLAQLGTGCIAVVWCLVFIRAAWDGRVVPSPIGNYSMAVSKPALGVYLSLLGALLAVGGTLMRLKEKPER